MNSEVNPINHTSGYLESLPRLETEVLGQGSQSNRPKL